MKTNFYDKFVKKKSIVTKVVMNVAITIISLSVCLSVSIENAFNREFTIAEAKYMQEVLSRISLEINAELNHYIDTVHGMAQSTATKDFLQRIEDSAANTNSTPIVTPTIVQTEELDVTQAEEPIVIPDVTQTEESNVPPFITQTEMPTEPPAAVQLESSIIENTTEINRANAVAKKRFSEFEGFENIVAELDNIATMMGGDVSYVTVYSIYKDSYLTHKGETGDDDLSFTLSNRPYYDAYTTKKTHITDPFPDHLTGATSIAITEPVFGDGNSVIGLISIEFTIDHLSNIVTSTTFGDTGATMLMDRNNNIMAYPISSVVGLNLSDLDYSGENADRELVNPTGAILDYKFGDTVRIGGIVTISETSGWKMLSAIDSSEFKGNITKVMTRLNIGLFFAILLSTFLCGKSIYKHLMPMQKLEDFMEELGKGNLNCMVDYDAPNEIGRLANHMNETAKTLSTYITTIDNVMKRLSSGDLRRPDVEFEFKGDFKNIEKSIEKFAFVLTESLFEIKLSIGQMNQGASQVSSGAQVLSQGSCEQATSVKELNDLVFNINETIVVTAKNSGSVTSDAKHISENLVVSNDNMQQLVVTVQDIRAMSDEVKRIIKTIEDVAFQTNILSLNASVEAARAGSAGAGFSVVADQVRILSAQTAAAAEETNKIITEIANSIEAGTDLAQTTSGELQQVVNDVEVFVDKISSISLSAQDQAAAISKINMGMDTISQVVDQNSAISQESAAASEELSSQSDQIVGLVDYFKLQK